MLGQGIKAEQIAAGSGAAAIVIAVLDALGIPVISTLPMGALLLAGPVVLTSAWLVAERWGGDREPDVRVLDVGMLALAIMAVIGIALGTLGVLSFRSILLTSGALGVIAGVVSIRFGPALPARSQTASLRDLLPGPGRWLESLPALALIGFAAFALVQGVGGRILRPPIGDSIAYHLPFAVEWMQQGNLMMPAAPAGDPSPPFYPINSSIWIYWLLAPFESEVLARFVQAPFLIFLFLAAYRLGLEVGLKRLGAIAAAAIIATVPGIARSSSIPENDLMLAALLVAATAFLAIFWRDPSAWRAIMVALVLGLAAGLKVTALPYVGLLGLLWLALVLRAWWPSNRRQVSIVLAGGAAIVALLGGYSYLRNLIVMDNPLYPAGYEIAGWRFLDGLYIVTREWRVTHAFYPFDWHGFFLGMREFFGATVTWWAIPGFVIAAAGVLAALRFRGTNNEADRRSLVPALALLIWTPLTLGIFWFIIPYHWERFLFPTVAWGAVLAAWGLRFWIARFLPRRADYLVALASVPVIAINTFKTPLDPAVQDRAIYWLALGLVVLGALLLPLVGVIARSSAGSRLGLAGTAVVLLAVVAFWPNYQDRYAERRFDEWRAQIGGFNQLPGAWEWIYHHTASEPATISVAGTNEIFPLYGPDLENQILTIWHSGESVEYGWGEPYRHYGEPDRESWEEQISRHDVDYVYMTADVSYGNWPVEREWIEAEPEHFELEFENEDVVIWRVSSAPD